MRNGFRTQPAYLVRGSSRGIMAMRFRPANIRVINRRVCYWAVIGPADPNPTRSKPTSRNVFPLRRPSRLWRVPQRWSPSRVRFAAPKCGAPLTASRGCGRTAIATGAPAGTLPAPKPKQKTHQKTWGLTGRSISERQLQPELDQTGIARTDDRVADREIGRDAAGAAE